MKKTHGYLVVMDLLKFFIIAEEIQIILVVHLPSVTRRQSFQSANMRSINAERFFMIKLIALFCILALAGCSFKFDKCESIKDLRERADCRKNSSFQDR